MEQIRIRELAKDFNAFANQTEDGVEFWYARDLQKVLGYAEWRNFISAIEKAKESCKVAGFEPSDHFPDIRKMVAMPKGAEKEVQDYMLTRYACYLIAQNGDPAKIEIAFAQTYFAIQTRKQEIIEERIQEIERIDARKKLTVTEKRFSGVLYEHSVDDKGFANIRNSGDQALFGGRSTNDMKKKLNVPQSRPLADFLPTITIKAKDLAAEITTFNVVRDNMQGEHHISNEHVRNNKDVRGLLAKSDIRPENLPAAEDVKKVERRVDSETKELHKTAKIQKLKKDK
jgi:DNA-damage-inducible protein D